VNIIIIIIIYHTGAPHNSEHVMNNLPRESIPHSGYAERCTPDFLITTN